jgi:hypothetical protein
MRDILSDEWYQQEFESMTLRINAELYEQLKWAVGLRPDLSMADVVRLAIKRNAYFDVPTDLCNPGDVVLNIQGVDVESYAIRRQLAAYLAEQREKVESRQTVPLDLEPCASYTVEPVQ